MSQPSKPTRRKPKSKTGPKKGAAPFLRPKGLAKPPKAEAQRKEHRCAPLEALELATKHPKALWEDAHAHLVASFLTPTSGKAAADPKAPHGAENILGIGIGQKFKKGQTTGQPCLRVYVRTKSKDVSKKYRVPKTIMGLPTDVIESGDIEFTATGEMPKRAQPGEAVRNVNGEYGTIGCLVASDASNTLYLLGNQHVLGLSNNAPDLSPIYYKPPGFEDEWKVAQYRKIDNSLWQFGGVNTIDAAIAWTDNRIVWPTLSSGPRISSEPVNPFVGMRVKKLSAPFGTRHGVVDDVRVHRTIPHPSGDVTFDYMIQVRSLDGGPFTEKGDSGTLLLSEEGNQPVGLLFSREGNVSYACYMTTVLSQLGVRLVTQF